MKIKLFKISVILSFFLAVLSSCSNEDLIDNYDRSSIENSKESLDKTIDPYLMIVVLRSPGPYKLSVIKLVRELTIYTGLKEAKALVDSAPSTLAITPIHNAYQMKWEFEQVGAEIELK